MAHHHHDHGQPNYNRAFVVAIALNIGFVIAEALFGFLTHSLALLADAGHNLGDVLGLALAWGRKLVGSCPSDSPLYLWAAAFFDFGGAAQCDDFAVCDGRDRDRSHPAISNSSRGQRRNRDRGCPSGDCYQWRDGAAVYVGSKARLKPERSLSAHGHRCRSVAGRSAGRNCNSRHGLAVV